MKQGVLGLKFLRCKPNQVPPSNGKKVAIIGAGTAGLGAAGVLKCKGYDVTVYDMLPEPGGMLIFGIHVDRIPKPPIREGVRELMDAGVEFVLNTKVGNRDLERMDELVKAKNVVDLEDIIKSYDAVLIATGTWTSNKSKVPGEELPWVYPAMEFLVATHLAKFGYRPWDIVPDVKGDLLVVGGGYTAEDAAYVPRTYPEYRDRMRRIVLSYRRTRNEAPMGPMEMTNIEASGVEIWELTVPIAYREENGRRIARIIRNRLVQAPGEKRPRPEPIPGSEFDAYFDFVLEAIGERPTPPFEGKECCGIKLTDWGTIVVDKDMMTSRKGVFAAGDVVHGPSQLGPALKSGMDAANAIMKYLSQR
ncbi:Glutamate synthase small subunit gltD [Acidilobus saccharovorans 345-15]|uniref:Glutamate synthase small subunit gltD n=1 Tax=Acidilobus saccharovorans (strain DSM 16705 / JCM 18335 / VKM B-2471 / 345-15) TaxID=666510 RepID=D9PZ44_ACIS3|nr:Glutamate synthase small subunit gltD [Acidilobus saccharovorans 345-15]